MASGDVVNTAARLQAAAPRNGILVDETTIRATERAIEYEEPSRSTRRARRSRSRSGRRCAGSRPRRRRATQRHAARRTRARAHTAREARGPRVAEEREPQLVTLVGVPGIGKSRLVSELFETIRAGAHRTRLLATRAIAALRRGRHLLGARRDGQGAGRHPRVRSARRDGGESSARPSSGALRRRRGGLGRAPSSAARRARRDETRLGRREAKHSRPGGAFSRRSHERASARARLRGSPLGRRGHARLRRLPRRPGERACRCSCSARPARSCSTRRPGWGGGKVNSSTILLSPLSEDETSTLAAVLCSGDAAIDAGVQERCSNTRAAIRCTPRSSPACSSSVPTRPSFRRRCKG